MKLAAEKLHTAEPVDEAAGQLAADKRRDKYVTLYKELVSELLNLINSDALWVILNISYLNTVNAVLNTIFIFVRKKLCFAIRLGKIGQTHRA